MTADETGASRIWGLDERGLHDGFWAGFGIKVVRRGAGAAHPSRASRYLLLEPDELVLFKPPAKAERTLRRRAAAVAIRVLDAEREPYAEQVVADACGRLIALRRLYDSPVRRERCVVLTSSPALASIWQGSPTRRAGLRDLRLAAGLDGYGHAACRGRCFDGSDPASARRCVLAMMSRWRDREATCRGVRSIQPGVWVHETAVVEPGARFVGPVWVGAGARIGAGQVVVGPRVLMDEAPTEPARITVSHRPRRAAPAAGAAAPTAARRRPTARRLFDVAFSAAMLALTAPLFPLIMLAIWLEDGRPVFFAHTRQTLGGRNFVCFKFRTMCRNAEQLKRQLARRNVCDGPQFHIEDDPRLLRVGRFLRRCHLDELPQFVNVLLGHMSVIGPRPSPDDENQFCPAWRDARLSVRPGVTGLWQVSRTRAPNADFQEWIRHDLNYVEQQSWALDLMIIAKTTGNIVGSLRARNGHAAGPRAVLRAGGTAAAGSLRRSAA